MIKIGLTLILIGASVICLIPALKVDPKISILLLALAQAAQLLPK